MRKDKRLYINFILCHASIAFFFTYKKRSLDAKINFIEGKFLLAIIRFILILGVKKGSFGSNFSKNGRNIEKIRAEKY